MPIHLSSTTKTTRPSPAAAAIANARQSVTVCGSVVATSCAAKANAVTSTAQASSGHRLISYSNMLTCVPPFATSLRDDHCQRDERDRPSHQPGDARDPDARPLVVGHLRHRLRHVVQR